MVDPADYIPVLEKVIGYLRVPVRLRDEAYSEGLVTLVRAAGSYRPVFGTKPETWITTKLLYGLRGWLTRECERQPLSIDEMGYDTPGPDGRESRVMLTQTLSVIEVELTVRERVALTGEAWGLTRAEVLRAVRVNTGQLNTLVDEARRRVLRRLELF